jgi:polar amino acid transport system substrate-binding protein
VGLDDTFAPMGFRDEANELVGFDIDLANAVGEELGWEIVFQPIAWDAKEMEMAAKNIDCVWNGMSRTPEREEMWTLSQNYLNNRIVIMTTPDVEITSLDQLAEYQIGTQAKSAALETVIASDVYESISANIQEYPTYDEVIMDMQAGRIQVMIVDEVLGQYKNANLDTKMNVATVDVGDDMYCIGFRKEDTALCTQVEDAIKAIAASGKGAEISEKWFGENLLLDMQ